MAQRLHTITDLADAAFVALGLHDLYGRFAAAALVDDVDGTVIDLRPFVGDDACVACAIEWAVDVAGDWHHAHRIIVLSADAQDVRKVREDDVWCFQELRTQLADVGFDLVDWIQTDGRQLRSLSVTCDVTPRWDESGRPRR